MAILSFTPADALQTLVVEAGTYRSIISKIEGPRPASSGKSNNIFVTVQITQDGKYKGKEKELMLNSAFKTVSDMDNGMRFYPFNTMIEINAAVNKTKIEAVNINVDTDTLVNRPLDVIWGVITVAGKLENVINGFLAEGAGSGSVVF